MTCTETLHPALGREIPHIVDRLEHRHPELSRPFIEEVVRAQARARARVRVQEFLPILIERAAEEILAA